MNRRDRNYGQDEFVDDAHSFRNDDGRPFRGNDEEDRWTGRDDQIRQRNTRRSGMGRDFDQDMAERDREHFGDDYRYRFDEERGRPPERPQQTRREQQVKSEYLEGPDRGGQRSRDLYGRGQTEQRRTQSKDERIEEEVCNALLRDRNINAQLIDVRVRGGIVTLSGTVGSRSARFDAEMATDSVSGVVDIENNIKVKKWTDQRFDHPNSYHSNREERELGEGWRSDPRRH